MLTLRQLKLFEAVARLKGFSRAANEMGVTQPAVSIQIKHLEDSVGLPLFEKAGKRLFLTPAGDELLRASDAILPRLRDLELGFAEMKGEIKGSLEVAAATTANFFMPQLLGAFQNRNPEVSPRLSVGNLQWMIERLSSKKDDLIVMSHVPDLPGLEVRPFLEDHLVVVAPPGHPLVRETRIPISRLAHEPFLLREPGSASRLSLENVFRDLGIRVRARMELGSSEAIKQAILSELGLSIMSSYNVSHELADGRLTVLDVNGFPLKRQWNAVTFQDKRQSLPARTFSAFIMSEEGRRIADAARPRFESIAPPPRPKAAAG
ncbi:MAG: LysR family transcriptional regulator [Rhodospirillales bacterium]|nr:LysR family transcriptional regulator [Rhodospirillales bacterium]